MFWLNFPVNIHLEYLANYLEYLADYLEYLMD